MNPVKLIIEKSMAFVKGNVSLVLLLVLIMTIVPALSFKTAQKSVSLYLLFAILSLIITVLSVYYVYTNFGLPGAVGTLAGALLGNILASILI